MEQFCNLSMTRLSHYPQSKLNENITVTKSALRFETPQSSVIVNFS